MLEDLQIPLVNAKSKRFWSTQSQRCKMTLGKSWEFSFPPKMTVTKFEYLNLSLMTSAMSLLLFRFEVHLKHDLPLTEAIVRCQSWVDRYREHYPGYCKHLEWKSLHKIAGMEGHGRGSLFSAQIRILETEVIAKARVHLIVRPWLSEIESLIREELTRILAYQSPRKTPPKKLNYYVPSPLPKNIEDQLATTGYFQSDEKALAELFTSTNTAAQSNPATPRTCTEHFKEGTPVRTPLKPRNTNIMTTPSKCNSPMQSPPPQKISFQLGCF